MENKEARRYLSLDYGTKFIGLASFFQTADPFPLCYGRIQNTSEASSINLLIKIIEDEFINTLVIGVPFLLDGQETSTTKMIKNFIKNLTLCLKEKNITCQVFSQDETLSTYSAQEEMKSSPLYNFKVDLTKIDSLAAKIILEDFLASQKSLD